MGKDCGVLSMMNTGLIISVTSIALIVSSVTTRSLPVVGFAKAVSVDHQTMRISVWKFRDCAYVSGTNTGWILPVGGFEWQEVDLTFPGDMSPGSSGPTGRIDLGLFRWDVPDNFEGQRKAVVLHNCEGRLKVSQIGPFT